MKAERLQCILWVCFYMMILCGISYGIGMLVSHYVNYAEEAKGQQKESDMQPVRGKAWQEESDVQQMYGKAWQEETQALQENPGISLPEAETQPKIRVQILSQDYEKDYHSSISVTSNENFFVERKPAKKQSERNRYAGGTCYEVKAEDMQEEEMICITSGIDAGRLTVKSLTRADGVPEYQGSLYLYREKEGILLVNELPLETYLYSVVSSEIPSGYPAEAQKAQAVCARTYAVNCMQSAKETDRLSDLDDSVSWQVYNNYRSTEQSIAAVDATRGEILDTGEALYYSTSCLSEQEKTLDNDAAFAAFLAEEPEPEAEYGSGWIRWETRIEHRKILEQLRLEYDCDVEQIDQIQVTERTKTGQVQKLTFLCGTNTIEAEGEYQIRKLLSPQDSVILLRDGTEATQMRMLPSAYFVLEDSEKIVYINGGGYGHGIGMSQCGCAARAEAGADYEEILRYYYHADLIRFNKGEELE